MIFLNQSKKLRLAYAYSKNILISKSTVIIYLITLFLLTNIVLLPFVKNNSSQINEEDKVQEILSVLENGNSNAEILGVEAEEYTEQSPSIITTDIEDEYNLSHVLDVYLESKNSPLAGLGSHIVSEGYRIGMDPKLFVAMSGVESNFCKIIPYNDDGTKTHNCHGWGKVGKKFKSFGSWKESVTGVMEGFRNAYQTSKINVDYIQNNYCPDCAGTNHWASGIKFYIAEIDQMYYAL